MTGSVFGMQMMVVTPPAAAARLVVDSVSRCSCARLAGEHEHIDEAWRENVAGAVDELRVANGVGSYLRAQVDDLAVLDQHAARLVEAGAGVDQPRVEERGASAVAVVEGLHRHHWFGRCRASA